MAGFVRKKPRFGISGVARQSVFVGEGGKPMIMSIKASKRGTSARSIGRIAVLRAVISCGLLLTSLAALGLSASVAHAGPFRLALESNADAAGGSEVFAANFATFNDFINSPPAVGGSFSGINIASTYSVRGFAHDGMYRLLLESNDDAAGGSEVFVASFATFDDFINSPPAVGGSFSGINISSSYSVGGFAWEKPAGQAVPEPGSLALVALGLVGLGLIRSKARPGRAPMSVNVRAFTPL